MNPIKRLYNPFLLSFLLPVLFLGTGFALMGIYPAGTQQVLVTDLWHQYYPFLRLLHEKLRSGGSLFYTWQSGLGQNFLSLYAYYAASPLNLLTVFFPESCLREVTALLILCKAGCSGLFCAVFLADHYHRRGGSLALFSLFYALSAYFLGYYWNLIWLDTVALLPLLLCGLGRLMRGRSPHLYILAVFLSLLTNFYIALFSCIACIPAAAYYILSSHQPKRTLRRLPLFLLSSLCGAGLCAFLLLPAYLALRQTYSVQGHFPVSHTHLYALTELIGSCLGFHAPTATDGLPNLGSSLFCIVCLMPYLTSRHIRLRQKLFCTLSVAFLLYSCMNRQLNYLWHGFHQPNMLPCRFSFLLPFLMTVIAYRVYLLAAAHQLGWLDWGAACAGSVLFLGIGFASEQPLSAVGLSAMIMLLYLAILLFALKPFQRRQYMQIGLCLIVGVECFCNVRLGTQAVRTSDRATYPPFHEQIESLMEQGTSRCELTQTYTLNDPALYGYPGVTQFSSMANAAVTSFLRSLGVGASEAGNRYFYAGGTPLTNAFLGVNTLYDRSGITPDAYNWIRTGQTTDVRRYGNRFALPLGFCVSDALAQMACMPDGDVFENQNRLFQAAAGTDAPLFIQIPGVPGIHEGATTYTNPGGYESFRADPAVTPHILHYSTTPQTDCVVYAALRVSDLESVEVYHEAHSLGKYAMGAQSYIIPVGALKKGEMAELRLTLKESAYVGSSEVQFYALQTEAWARAVQGFQRGGFQMQSWTDTRLTGTVTADAGQMLYLSVPYDGGWSAQVDGVPAELLPAGGAMTLLPLTSGTHSVSLSYTPPGFSAGLLITSMTVLLWFPLLLLRLRQNWRSQHEK